MDDKVLSVCPHATKINTGNTVYGCGARPNRMIAGSTYKTYLPPCTKACAEGDYEKCPWFPP